MKPTNIALLLVLLLGSSSTAVSANPQDHDEAEQHSEHGDGDDHGEESEQGLVEVTDHAMSLAGITAEKLTPQILPRLVYAPGEVQLDQYRSADVTPLVDSLISERHAILGDQVEAGQTLVTLVSIEVVAAQGELMVAATEWRRVRRLGKATVSAKRYTEAEVAYQQARLRLLAYGLDQKQIKAIASGKQQRPLGEFDLNAPLAGTVLRDDFRVGQRIEPGQSLFLIADESRIWVKANLSPLQASDIEVGMSAQVKMNGHWHTGQVIQKHHLLDEQTRTVPVRITVDPDGEHHHSGEFVHVAIAVEEADAQPTLAVPEAALIQDDEGNWTVFVQVKAGHFKQMPVHRGEAQGTLVPISGIPGGVTVVTKGAFFLSAELAKSGFDIHNH